MNDAVLRMDGRSKFATPKTPWPLVQPPARRVPKPMNNPPANIQASLPAGPNPIAVSNIPSAHVGDQPPPRTADRNPPSTRPAANGMRHGRPDVTSERRKYGVEMTNPHRSSKLDEMPSRRFATNSNVSVTAAMAAPAIAQ